ncbi:serine/threonine protein kinase [Gordonia sp. PP30]|uniref:serine/threonine-protein kinase n=1 Tax=Gordonia sp. PP30 TaxID=2935861 RepID=UPI001FFF70AE|nr:serine/threonine-protein kinase [Gordonia sp. PP30]UQE76590.1 serine/threonine protein kinase [Gordonia sp. PP30]
MVGLIGRGGVGDVYSATRPDGTVAAVKVIRVRNTGTSAQRGFDRECLLLSRLHHRNIVEILDHGRTGANRWLAMQYVPGLTAAEVRTRRPAALTPVTVSHIVTAIADALDYAHQNGVIHRDVKPSNILLTFGPDGSLSDAFLSDFGIAITNDHDDRADDESVPGSAGFTAPERLQNLPPTPASDQYSLACTAFTLLTGRTPFAAESLAGQVYAQLHNLPPPASSLNGAVPSGIDAVLDHALSRHPTDRYPSCREFAARLAAASGVTLRTVAPADNRPDHGLYQDTLPPDATTPPGSRRRGKVAVGVVGVAVVAGLALSAALFAVRDAPSNKDDRRAAAGARLCDEIQRAASDPQFSQSQNLENVRDLAPGSDDLAGAGCRFHLDASMGGMTDVPVSLGYTATLPADSAPLAEPAVHGQYYWSARTSEDRIDCVYSVKTEVGYLNLRGSIDPTGPGTTCEYYKYTLAELQLRGVGSPAT